VLIFALIQDFKIILPRKYTSFTILKLSCNEHDIDAITECFAILYPLLSITMVHIEKYFTCAQQSSGQQEMSWKNTQERGRTIPPAAVLMETQSENRNFSKSY
jgi:hypothetical protein